MNPKMMIVLFALFAALSCGQRRPGVSRKEAVAELIAFEAVKDSIRMSRMNASASLDTFPEDYLPKPGIRYEPKIITANVKVLDVKAALADVRNLQPDAFGHVSLYPIGHRFKVLQSITPILQGEAWLVNALEGIALLDSQLKYIMTLFENDVEIQQMSDSAISCVMRRYLMDAVFLEEPDERICAYYVGIPVDGHASERAFATLPFGQMAISDKPWTPDDMTSKLPVGKVEKLSVYGDGFLVVEPFSSRLGVYGAMGDTLCRFTVNDTPDYVPVRAYRRAESSDVYRIGARTMVRIPYDNTIYALEDASTLNAVYRLDFGDLKRPDGKYVVETINNSLEGYHIIENVTETDGHLFVSMYQPVERNGEKDKYYFLVYDKRSGDFYSIAQKEGRNAHIPAIPFTIGKDTLSFHSLNVADGRLYTQMSAKLLKGLLPSVTSLEGVDDETSVIIMTDKQ